MRKNKKAIVRVDMSEKGSRGERDLFTRKMRLPVLAVGDLLVVSEGGDDPDLTLKVKARTFSAETGRWTYDCQIVSAEDGNSLDTLAAHGFKTAMIHSLEMAAT